MSVQIDDTPGGFADGVEAAQDAAREQSAQSGCCGSGAAADTSCCGEPAARGDCCGEPAVDAGSSCCG